MFALSERDLGLRILGCVDGPASFNAVLTRRGGSVVSVDPIYQFHKNSFAPGSTRRTTGCSPRCGRTKANLCGHTSNPWRRWGGRAWPPWKPSSKTTKPGLREGRYVVGALPELPFPEDAFDLALCSHFLFLYSEQFSSEFHLRSIQELCRVAKEVRIFPLPRTAPAPPGTWSTSFRRCLRRGIRPRSKGCHTSSKRAGTGCRYDGFKMPLAGSRKPRRWNRNGRRAAEQGRGCGA